MNNQHIGAFFDFDQTLLKTESAKLGLKYLWEQRLLSTRLLLKIVVANFFFQRHLVSDETVARIILKFYRGKQASSVSPTGTGLGMTLVKHITEAHGGQIEVHSEPGRGSVFAIILPLSSSRQR